MTIKKCIIVANGEIFNDIAVLENDQTHAIFSKSYIGVPYARVFENYSKTLEYMKQNFSANLIEKCQILTVEGDYKEKITYIQLIKENMTKYTGYMIESYPMLSATIH